MLRSKIEGKIIPITEKNTTETMDPFHLAPLVLSIEKRSLNALSPQTFPPGSAVPQRSSPSAAHAVWLVM